MLDFWVFVSQNLTLYAMMHHVVMETQTYLERLDTTVMEEETWNKVAIGIGRQRARFAIGFNLVYYDEGNSCF
jgi:hypothetical protein